MVDMDWLLRWFPLAALACLLGLGMGRTVALHARRVQTVVVDPQRTKTQLLLDSLLAVSLLLWLYLVIGYSWPLPTPPVPSWLGTQVLDAVTTKLVGVVMLVAAVVLYGSALWAMGDSWRIGIDRTRPGGLVTRGVFGWSRNPIYLAFDLLLIGTFLLEGRLIFLLLALAVVLLIHETVLREERFLAAQYGDSYREFRARVGRYVTWRARRKSQGNRQPA